MKIFIHWFVSAAAILISAYILHGVHVSGIVTALVLAVILGAINSFVRPVLIVLTLPITVMTLGLFLLIINTLLIMLAAVIVPGFSIDGFWWALLFGIVLALINAFLNKIAKN